MTEKEKYMAMRGFQQHLKLIRSNTSNQQSGQGGGYRPQPSSLPRPQASQVSYSLSLSLSLPPLSSGCYLSSNILHIFYR